MSIIEDVTVAAETFEEKVAQVTADADKLRALVQGPSVGAGSDVDLGGDAGTVKTPARVLAEAEAGLLAALNAPLGFTLVFDGASQANSDPGPGKFRLGDAVQKNAVVLRSSEIDSFGASIASILDEYTAADNPVTGHVLIVKKDDRSKRLVFRVSAQAGAVDYRNITIENILFSANSPFSDNDTCLFAFVRAGEEGAPGADGAGAGDVQSDDDPTVVENILAWATTNKHVKGKALASLLAGAGTVAAQKVFGPWSGVTLAGTCDISASNTIFVAITAGTGPITSFGTTRDGWLRIVRADVAFTITRHATNLETPNQADVTVAAGDHLIVARESSESAGKTRVLEVIKADGRAYRGPNDIPQNLSFSGVITPSQITTNQNDYAPTGHQTALIERLSADATRSISGLAAPTSGRPEVRILLNVGSFNIVLSDQDSSSSAANRFAFGKNVTIKPSKVVIAVYDTTSSRWRPLAQVLDWGALAELDRVTDIDQALSLSGDISPSQLTANTNDWAPTGLSTATTIRASTDASRDLTGISAPSTKRKLRIFNTGSNNLVLKNEDSNSTAANRFSFGADRTLAAGDGVELWYDLTSARWRAVAIISTGGGGGGTSIWGVCDGRLTLVTATPVMTASQTAKSTLYWAPYGGGQIGLYDGSTAWTVVSATEKSIKLTDAQTGTTTSGTPVISDLTDTSQLLVGMKVSGTGVGAAAVINAIDSATQVTLSVNSTANGSNTITFKAPASSVFDVFGFNNSGALKLELFKWTNTTTRAVALAWQDGVLVKSGATTRRYLGTIATTTTDGETEFSFGGSASGGTAANLLVWNYYKRREVEALVRDTASTWSYATGSYRSANNSTGNRVNFIVGVSEDRVSAIYSAGVQRATNSTSPGIGIGLDSASVASGIEATIYGSSSASATGSLSQASGWQWKDQDGLNHAFSTITVSVSPTVTPTPGAMLDARYSGYPGAGLHYLQALEIGAASAVFSGSGNGVAAGLTARMQM